MTRAEMDRYENELAKIKVKCQCSHIMLFPFFGPDVKVCTHCGKRVFRNERVRFKTLLSEEVNRCQSLTIMKA